MDEFFKQIPEPFATLPQVPPALLEAQVEDLFAILQSPTIIALPGLKQPPVFVSTLLHGNEHTGFLAMQRLLNEYQRTGRPWPRSVYWLIGNVEAASRNRRHLDHQPDFNRIWKGGDSDMAKAAQKLVQVVARSALFANIDVHNNTGKNPHYACISQPRQEHRYLASLFGRTAIYFRTPSTAQSVVFSEFLPSVTIECGLTRNPRGTEEAAEFIDAVMRLDHFPETDHTELELFQTVARILLPPDTTVGFGKGDQVDFRFRHDLDELNFQPLPVGTILGWSLTGQQLRLEPTEGVDASDWFAYEKGNILTKEEIIPSMFTKDQRVIRQDCLGYVMRRVGPTF